VVAMLNILDKDIDILKLNEDTVNILKKNKIIKVKQLANKSKTKLKDIGLLGDQITEIEVKLQLEGLDLKGNY
jgi:DNA-directed RNA polymerase alpha subunit